MSALTIETEDLCCLGCGQTAKFIRKNQKKYCSSHYNSCPKKRKNFSENVDHKSYSQKSLKTRIEKGITKSSQIKAAKTRKESGHYERLAGKMREYWEERPWNNKPQWAKFPKTDIQIQSSYEYNFLKELEDTHGLDWVQQNVKRGPCFYYTDPVCLKQRMYISDFIIGETIYEIKGDYTWNRKGKDVDLQKQNEAKLDSIEQFDVVLILEGEAILWSQKQKDNSCG